MHLFERILFLLGLRNHLFMFRTPKTLVTKTIFQLTRLSSIGICSILLCSCLEEASSSDAANLEKLMHELNTAVLSDDTSGLESIIDAAKRLPQGSGAKAKTLILSTAQAKLGKISGKRISGETALVSASFKHAVLVANQASMLRSAATAMSAAAKLDGGDAAATYQTSMKQVKETLHRQLDQARADISRLSYESEKAEVIAKALLEEANTLLVIAEELDDVDGLKPFKKGMAKMRKSDQSHLLAVTKEIESTFIAARQADDASVELEALALRLQGIRYSMELLGTFRQTSKEGASELRKLADERDSASAAILTESTQLASELLTRWESASTLLEESIQSRGGGRSTQSKESKAAGDSWKLKTAWSLGQMQESQVNFLTEECAALTEVLDSGIVTGATRWQTILEACQAQVTQLTAASLQSYEKAKETARELGRDGESSVFQLDVRIAKLSGTASPVTPNTPEETPQDNTTSQSTSTGSGFSTPQELVVFINENFGFASESKAYLKKTPNAKKVFDTVQSLYAGFDQLSTAIDEKFGNKGSSSLRAFENMIPEFAADPSTIVMVTDDTATITVSNHLYTMLKTENGWLVDFDAVVESVGLMQQLPQITKVVRALQSVTAQINDGSITDVGQLQFAIGAAMMGG